MILPRCLLSPVLALLLGLSLTDSKSETNLFENGDLEWGLERWKNQSSADPCEVTPSGPDGAPAMTFRMPEEGKRKFNSHQDTDLSLAEKYRLSFWARADSQIRVLVAPQRGEGDYGAIGRGATASIGSEWKEFHLKITITEATSNGRLTFLPLDPIPAGLIQFANFRL
jgi:hypothetical protein